ncbi:hypothetical protein [Salinibacter grassmerensis]|uniref:hypothetical protein n=1 Tax=Salinibacter grassmerensis TaxID=3040353 RepID=UPI0021E8A0F3|nr:hypothetical protein [Salinibacter grassmerensis]
MPDIDLSFLLEDPLGADATGTLTVEPLVPLSMNTSVPGKHFQTETTPPKRQLYGMIENAFGLHFGWDKGAFGYKLKQTLADEAEADVSISGRRSRDYQPLLAPYYELELTEAPGTETYDDTQWLHKWRDTARIRASASNQDWRGVQDEAGNYGYGKTPVKREYVVTDGPWVYDVDTTKAAGNALRAALKAPRGPLYLGTSDGWVDVHFHFTSE